jgi:hypothetical protein
MARAWSTETDLAPEGHQRDGDELEVPEPKWNPDDRHAQERAGDQV